MRVVVIGAGASGLVCAISLARRGIEVSVVERLNSNGKKILVTGNGRCNYWNEDFNSNHFFSNNMNFINDVNTLENRKMVLDFFESVGIVPNIKNGYYYPMSMQASSVRDTLLNEAKKLKIKFINDFNVKDIKRINEKFFIISDNGEIVSDKVIIACGSYSYYKDKTTIYDICQKLGHKILPVLPSLVQLVGSDSFYKEWDGVRSNVKVKLLINNLFIKEEIGEVMLTNYGVSGICIFNLSGYVNRALHNKKDVKVLIDFLPTIDNLYEFLEERSKIVDYKLYEFLLSLLNNKLVDVILKRCDLDKEAYWNNLNLIEKNNLVKRIKEFEVNIISSKSFDNSQVCTGGVDTLEIDSSTMESKICNNLYIIGETLDVDGECGGYNLGFAWLTGLIAGRSVKDD